jgi:GT2 family glycosyltransferase
MVAAVKKSEGIGMASGKLYKMSGNGSAKLLDTTGIEMPYYFQRPRGDAQEDRGQYDKEEYVFGPCGAAPLYRRQMLEDIKINGEYFDEDFVNYVEDVDLAWRAQLRGWMCAYAPRAIAYHFRGCTRANDKAVKKGYYRMGYRNRYWAMYKNITAAEFKKNLFKIFLKETVFLLTKKPGECSRAIPLQSLGDAIAGLGSIGKKRKLIQERVKVRPAYLEQFFKFKELSFPEQVIGLSVTFVRRRVVYPCMKAAYIIYNRRGLVKRTARFCLKPFVPSFRRKR